MRFDRTSKGEFHDDPQLFSQTNQDEGVSMVTSIMKSSRAIVALVAIVAVTFALLWVGCSNEPQSPIAPSAAVQQQGGTLSKSSPQVQAVMAVQNRHTDRLLAIRGVVGTATGLTDEGKLAVKIYTVERGAEAALPQTLEGVPVVVEATGAFFALQSADDKGVRGDAKGGGATKINPTARFVRPVPIGVSTGNEGECSAGTIGARVKSGTKVYALSNNHVYALENKAPIGSSVLQPGRYDVGCALIPSDAIGTLSAFVQIQFGGSDNTVDAAIAVSSTGNLGNGTPSNGYGVPSSTTVVEFVGQPVQKYGRTTGLTKGKVSGINATVNVDYGSSGVARFVGQIVVSGNKGPFTKAGDSGSLIVTNDSSTNPVGLLFAGSSNGTAIANKIGDVLSAFNVTIDGK